MEIFKKKIPSFIVIGLICIAGAIAYSFGYSMAMKKFNDIVSYTKQKEYMYAQLSELDHIFRQEYIGEIDENNLMEGICSGYISGTNSPLCKYLSQDEYKKFASKLSADENNISYEDIDGQFGYIKINDVTHDIGSTFFNTVTSLYDNGISKIILDLRLLSGNNIESIEKCLDSVAFPGRTIYRIDKKGSKEEVYKTNSDRLDIKFSVLVDRDTAGIPELIVAALKDSGLGKVIGEVTQGKCVEEKAIPLSDGSGVVFPVAHYVIGDGEILTGKGVNPDIEISLDDDKRELLKRGELSHKNDDQFQEAVKSLL